MFVSGFNARRPAFGAGVGEDRAGVFTVRRPGVVVVDDVGLARLHPGFRAARVPRG